MESKSCYCLYFYHLDALCCCQSNNIPELCLGFCMGQDAEGNEGSVNVEEEYEEEADTSETKNTTKPPFWFVVNIF